VSDARSQVAPAFRRKRSARRKQRHANDLIELRLVSLPAHPRARPIFGDENLAESVLWAVDQRSNFASQGEKKRRKWGHLNNRATVAVIPVAEGYHLAIRKMAMEVERFERERGDLAGERRPLL
jgi:hypothetical protein